MPSTRTSCPTRCHGPICAASSRCGPGRAWSATTWRPRPYLSCRGCGRCERALFACASTRWGRVRSTTSTRPTWTACCPSPSTPSAGSSNATPVPLSVSKHPLVADSLRGLRDSTTQPDEFRALARNVITMLLYEATADLPVKHGKVRTPLAEADAIEVETEVVAIPVLRAGLGLLAPVLELLPRVSVGYIGLERDETTAVARIYYNKLPHLRGKIPLLLDPMLATGGSAAQALDLIKAAGGRNTRMICIVAAPEGVRVLQERHPEVDIYTAALDERLNDRAYIVPGLGDFGDRLFGTG